MNLTALQARCAERFRDPTNKIVTATQWKSYLNEAYHDVVNASPFWEFKEVVSNGSLTVNAGSQYVALPTDAVRVLAVRNATDDVVLHQLDGRRAHLDAYPDGDDTGVPTYYRVFAGRIYVFPTPEANTVLDIETMSPPVDLSSGSDEPVFPEPFHSMLIEGALARAHADDGDFNRQASCQAAFDGTLSRMLSDLLGTAREDHYPAIIDDWFD